MPKDKHKHGASWHTASWYAVLVRRILALTLFVPDLQYLAARKAVASGHACEHTTPERHQKTCWRCAYCSGLSLTLSTFMLTW